MISQHLCQLQNEPSWKKEEPYIDVSVLIWASHHKLSQLCNCQLLNILDRCCKGISQLCNYILETFLIKWKFLTVYKYIIYYTIYITYWSLYIIGLYSWFWKGRLEVFLLLSSGLNMKLTGIFLYPFPFLYLHFAFFTLGIITFKYFYEWDNIW